jgi:hypothetical protein
MNYRFLFIVLAIACSQTSHAASGTIEIKSSGQCSYSGEILPGSVYAFTADYTAEAMIDEITAYSGLRRNFIVRASNVPNAAAVNQDGQRFLLYNQEFMASVKEKTHSYWAAMTIMAHEVGHHLQGHTLDGAAGRPERELEADEYSGFIVEKMGATLKESQAAINIFAPNEGSSTYPPKKTRLLAVRAGWTKAFELNKSPKLAEPSSQLASIATEGINRYEVQGGWVKDTQTNLIWTRCSLGQKWDGSSCLRMAKKFQRDHILTKHFDFSGYKDWRIPTIKELQTLFYCSSEQPALWNDTGRACEGSFARPVIFSKVFPNTAYDTAFLSSSLNEYDSSKVWVADFYDGSSHSENKDGFFAVRLVRG